MIGLAQIMAQIGSFVPASIATLRLCDQLFTRFGQNDDLESNYSSFEVEMNDVKYILENLSDTSLVLIDELCRCTCSEDGLAIAHAISEHFIDKKAFVIISTHFLDLTNLDGLYPNVANYHFSEQTVEHQTFENEINQQLALNHTLKPGPYRGPLYGFEIAALSSMPKEIIENAKRLAEEIHAKRQAAFGAEIAKRKKDRAIMNLYHKLIDASKQVNVNNEELRVYLKSLKEQYLKEINGLSSASSPVVEHVEIA